MVFVVVLGEYKKSLFKTSKESLNSLTISAMREKTYPGSEIKIEQVLEVGDAYNSYIVSYKSDGLKIHGLLTIPNPSASSGQVKPKGGWPAIIFNHGYIPPEVYQTTERYVNYVDAFARSGYVVLKPDYRGNGASEGTPENAYYSEAYTTDVLNAVASIKKLKAPMNGQALIVNPEKIGMWGHSMGGNVTLRSLVVSKDIKAGIIWAGVVGSYDEIMNKWTRKVPFVLSIKEVSAKNDLIKKYGTPKKNPDFWNSVDPTSSLSYIQTPIQIHHAQDDEEVPLIFSISLKNRLISAGKNVQLYVYPDGDHNIGEPNFDLAMQRSIAFFDKYLK